MNDGRYDQPYITGSLLGDDIVLDIGPGDWQKREFMKRIRPHFTALPHLADLEHKGKKDKATVPRTWALVTQLARLSEQYGYTWRPDAYLTEWIYAEFMRRHDEGGWKAGDETFADGLLKYDTSRLGRSPYAHQLAGAYVTALNRRMFLADTMGTGKTATALLAIAEMEARGINPWPVFIIAPASVTDPWAEEIREWDFGWPFAFYQGPRRSLLSSRYKIYLMSWDVFRADMQFPKKPALDIDGNPLMKLTGTLGKDGNPVKKPVMEEDRTRLPSLLSFVQPRTVIMDEAHALCCTADAVVQTSAGLKRICDVREGDRVRGVDHDTGKYTWTPVLKVGRSSLRPTVRLGDLELTPDHPVWVSESGCIGYASSHDEDIHLRGLRDIVRPEVVSVLAGTEVLLAGAQIRGGEGESRSAGCGEEGERGVSCFGKIQGVSSLGKEPVYRGIWQGDQVARLSDEQAAWVSGTNGPERGAYYPAGAVAEAARLRVHPRVLSRPGAAATGLPDELQGGPGLSAPETGCGTGRELTPLEAKAGTGPEKGREASVTWMDGTSLLELGSPERYLWNLATDTGNYVASGILVHNCNTRTKQSVAARRIARVTENAILLSGTPITHDVGGFWSALNVLDTRSFPDQDRYKERYADTHSEDYGQRKVDGLTTVNRQEFYTLMQGTMRRVAKEDVLRNLPAKTYSTRAVHIPGAYRAAYDEMEADMIAHLPDTDEPLPVMNTLAQLQRLSQLASSACDVEIEEVIDEKEGSPTYGELVPHYKVTMRDPSWKVDELIAIMEETEGEPVVTFSPHAQLMAIAGSRAEKHGYRVGYIRGGQSKAQRSAARHSFQNGEFDLLCVTTSAGGVGITLTRSHIAVFLERPWAHWQSSQAEDRLHRPGQEETVHIIDVVAADSIESRVREALKDKARSLADLVRDERIVRGLLGGQPLRV